MRVGLTLSGDDLSENGARFAAQLGVRDVVVHFNDYAAGPDAAPYLRGEVVGPVLKDCRDVRLWDYETMSAAAAMLARHGLSIAALENFSPAFWSDILLDGPNRVAQMEGLKKLVRDAGRVGIPVIGYNFSIAGVWGWRKRRAARGGAMTVVMDLTEEERNTPIPDGMVWNMRYRAGDPAAAPVRVDEAEIWERFAWFLRQLVPVAEEAGVRLAAHPDDPPVESLRGTARLVNRPEKYDRLLALAPSHANALEFCIGSLQEMPGCDIYEVTRYYARRNALAYVHFRNVRGRVPAYVESFVEDGDVDMTEIIRILRDEGFTGVLVPDHVPELTCAAPWHAGHAFTVGYMKALVGLAPALGPSWSASQPSTATGEPRQPVSAP